MLHVSRRPVQSRQYDLPIEWMSPKSGWRKAETDKSAKFRRFEFLATPKEERAAFVRSARGGATVPAVYLEDLEAAARTGRLERYVDEIAAAESCDCEDKADAIRLTFSQGGGAVVADRVILATGSTLDINNVPLLRSVADRFELPVAGCLPDLEDLQWGDESFTVVGAFSILEMGPDAGNLTGCRRCAEICADAHGVFDKFTQVGERLANSYAALVASDSDSDDETEEEEEEQGCGSSGEERSAAEAAS